MILALLVTQIVAMPCSILFANLAAKITARKALIGAILMYTFICIVGFYMGFSLEPHQNAYEAAIQADYSAVVEASAPDDTEQLTLYRHLAEAFENRIHDGDAAELAAEAEKDDYAALLPENKTALLAAANAFVTDHAAMLDGLRGAIRLSTILFWAMATLVGTVQGGIQAVSRSYFGKLIPKERSNEYFGFFDIFGKFASVLGPFLYSLIGTWTGRSSYGVLALIALFLVGLIIMISGKSELEALESGRRA